MRCKTSLHILRALSPGSQASLDQAIDFQRNRARLGEPSRLQTQDHSSFAAPVLRPRISSVPSLDLATPRATNRSGRATNERIVMSVALIGRKAGMTRIFTDAGETVPVTVIEVLPNRITQVKSVDKDGYRAIQVIFRQEASAAAVEGRRGSLRESECRAGQVAGRIPPHRKRRHRSRRRQPNSRPASSKWAPSST